MTNIRVAVVQDGARLHYAVPLAFKRSGMLAALYTDWYNRQTLRTRLNIKMADLLSPSNALRMRQRRTDELDDIPIYDHSILFYGVYLARKRGRMRQMISSWSMNQIRRKERKYGPIAQGEIDLVFAFSNMMDMVDAKWVKSKGSLLVFDQPLATILEVAMQNTYAQHRWPGWGRSLSANNNDGPMLLREIEAVLMADHITCASEYVKKSLLNLKINPEKISVLPYPLDVTHFPFIDRSGRSGPITVGIIGTVNLRKGAPVIMEIAKKFPTAKVRIVWVGISTLPPERARELGSHVELTGPVSRSQIPQWLEKFDIFLLASRAEGSPSALMEAMASGLPVVTTTNSGTVARDGIEGYIREIDDIDGMAAAIEKLVSNTELRLTMGQAARQRVLNFNIEWYGQSLTDLATRLV